MACQRALNAPAPLKCLAIILFPWGWVLGKYTRIEYFFKGGLLVSRGEIGEVWQRYFR